MTEQLPPGRGASSGIVDLVTRLVAVVATALLLVASLFVGAFVALTLLGFVAIIWLVFAFRWWQAKRRWRSTERPNPTQPRAEPGSTTVEGDYRVVRNDREPRP